MNTLRGRYLDVCDDLIRDVGRPRRVNHVVPEEASLKECVGYLDEYVVRDRQHFRYDRYLNMLTYCFDLHRGTGAGTEREHTIVHVDLGTGPGVFHWVMHDYVQYRWSPDQRPQLRLFGYDQCSSMVRLANLIWDEFNIGEPIDYLSNPIELVRVVGDIPSDAHLVVTFGHLLIQANRLGRRAEMVKLARLCGELSDSKRTTDIVAVDAYSFDYRHQFNRAASELVRELYNYSDSGDWRQISIDGKILSEGSRAIIRNWGAS